MFDCLVEKIRKLLPDFGKDLAIDGKALPTHGFKDAEAEWAVKTYKGLNKAGKPFEKTIRWFGYRLHLIADVNYPKNGSWPDFFCGFF